jgi:LCP family protein required for cell wall assembly
MPAGMIDLSPTPAKRFTGKGALLSSILPGAGQWWLGRRWRALLMALFAVASLGAVLYLYGRGKVNLLAVFSQPKWLWTLVGINAALFLVRVVAVLDAWWLERQPGTGWKWPILSLLPGLAVAAALTVPQFFVHDYALVTLDTLDKVFIEPGEVPPLEQRIQDQLAQGLDPEDLGPTPSTTSTTAPTTTTTGAGTTTSSSSTTSTTLSPEEALAQQMGTNLVTVLLAGGDFGPGRRDLRTDVMIVAVLDLEVGKAALISVSRDLVQFPLPEAWARDDLMIGVQSWHEDQAYQKRVEAALAAGEEPPEKPLWAYCNCYADRINYLHVHTANWVNTFPEAPDPGMEALRQTLEVALGLPIDDYVLVDFAGFVDVVDAIGGVTVHSTESMHIKVSPAKPGEPEIVINITPGDQHLDGRTALAYVRNRIDSSDGRRMLRQRCMLRDLAGELDAATLLTRFTAIMRAIANSTTTTMPLELLPDVIQAIATLDTDDITTAAIGWPGQTNGSNYMGLPILDADAARARVAEVIAGFYAPDSGTSGEPAEDECG